MATLSEQAEKILVRLGLRRPQPARRRRLGLADLPWWEAVQIPFERGEQPGGAAGSVDYYVTAEDGARIPVKRYGRRTGATRRVSGQDGLLHPPTMQS
jgi:hypothetical protein